MDWANERYVRLYVRDTLTWKRLGHEGRCMVALIMRKLDRCGILEVDGCELAEAVSILTESPYEFAKTGIERILELGVMEFADGQLVAPNFVEAQEAKQTDAQRSREYRARRRDRARGREAPPSRDESDRHTTSHGVTPSCAEPSCTEPSQTVSQVAETAPRRKPPPSQGSIEVAQELYDAIRSHTPTFHEGTPPAKLERKLTGWARDIDVGLRNDGMTQEGCFEVIAYAHRSDDTFWHGNLLSGRKLRKHYQAILVKARKRPHSSNAPPGYYERLAR